MESGGKFPIVKIRRNHERGDEIHRTLSFLSLPLPSSPLHSLLADGRQPVTSWLLVWLLSLVLPIAPPSVLCSLSATLLRFRTYRLAGNTPPSTTETCFTSTSTPIMRLSAGRSWIWSSTTTGRRWLWCMKIAQVWVGLTQALTWPCVVGIKGTRVFSRHQLIRQSAWRWSFIWS